MATQPKPRKPRERKPETVIRELRRELKEATASRGKVIQDAFGWRTRATKAEQEAADWKRRFDALLDAVPELRKVQDDGLLRPGQLAAVAKAERAASTPQGEAAARGRDKR